MVRISKTLFNTVTRSGFLKEFNKRIYRKKDRMTHLAAFEELNDLYFDAFGEYRFPSFEAFLKYRSRAHEEIRKKQNQDNGKREY